MKKNILWIAALIAAVPLMSCASGAKTEAKTTEAAAPAASNNPYGLTAERYSQLMDMAVVTTGNTYRLKKVIEKLRAGQEVYIAALGGSVTEGAGPSNYKDGYAYKFASKLKEAYTPNKGANVYFDGAGLSGTPSQLGLVRYESDVVEVLGNNPDLLIIEFAVNDDGSDQSTRAFEALVRNALLANSEACVIGLYSAATYGNSAGAKKPVGDFYRIPQVNVLPVVKDAFAKGDFAQNKYYTDNVHPTKEGHEFQADCLMALIEKTDKAPAAEAYPVPEDWCKSSDKAFTNFTRILGDDENVKITAGGFKSKDPATQSIKKTNKGDFPNNWYKAPGDKAEDFVMDITCKGLIFTYKEQGSWLTDKFGKAEVYVDGNLAYTFDGGKAGGWCNCVPVVIIDDNKVSSHKVVVKMAKGDEGKGFTIVAMGYSK